MAWSKKWTETSETMTKQKENALNSNIRAPKGTNNGPWFTILSTIYRISEENTSKIWKEPLPVVKSADNYSKAKYSKYVIFSDLSGFLKNTKSPNWLSGVVLDKLNPLMPWSLQILIHSTFTETCTKKPFIYLKDNEEKATLCPNFQAHRPAKLMQIMEQPFPKMEVIMTLYPSPLLTPKSAVPFSILGLRSFQNSVIWI